MRKKGKNIADPELKHFLGNQYREFGSDDIYLLCMVEYAVLSFINLETGQRLCDPEPINPEHLAYYKGRIWMTGEDLSELIHLKFWVCVKDFADE